MSERLAHSQENHNQPSLKELLLQVIANLTEEDSHLALAIIKKLETMLLEQKRVKPNRSTLYTSIYSLYEGGYLLRSRTTAKRGAHEYYLSEEAKKMLARVQRSN